MVQPISSKLDLTGFLESRTGGRPENQDFAGVAETPLGTLIVVCDGMGGMKGGSTASRLAVTMILDTMKKADTDTDPRQQLTDAIKEANKAVYGVGNSHQELQGMGTTVTALLLNEQCAYVAYVGDSRIYQLRKGKKVYRSFDHSMVFEMVKQKVITEEQARLSAQSNVIMRAVGIKEEVDVSTSRLSYRKGDRFILCTDGLWGVMPEEEFLDLVTSPEKLNKVIESSCNTVEAVARKKGGEYDNLTAALIEMNCKSKLQPKMNRTAKILIAVITVFLLVSVAFNFREIIMPSPQPVSIYSGKVDSVKVDKNSTAIYIPAALKNQLPDSTAIVITEKK